MLRLRCEVSSRLAQKAGVPNCLKDRTLFKIKTEQLFSLQWHMASRRNLIILMLWVGALLPFCGRAWFFDDPALVEAAKAVMRHPLHPFTFVWDLAVPNTQVWPRGSLPAHTHGPLNTWILAFLFAVFGAREWPVHLMMVAMMAVGLWAGGQVFRRFTDRPWRPLFILAFSPAIFVVTLSSYPQLQYFVAYTMALWCALAGSEKPSLRWTLGLSAALLAAALSVHSWPLLVLIVGCVYALRGRNTQNAGTHFGISFLSFAAAYGAWALWETHVYGKPHFAASFQVRAIEGTRPSAFTIILPSVFFAGVFPAILVTWPKLAKKSGVISALLVIAAVSLTVFLMSPRGGFTPWQAAFIGLFFATGWAFLSTLLLRWKNWTAMERLAVIWFAGEFIYLQVFFRLPAARHFLIVLIPAAILCARMGERLPRWSQIVGCVGLVGLCLALAHADVCLAGIGRRLPVDLSAMPAAYYWGNSYSGFSYYLKQKGWKAFDIRQTPKKGDRVLVASNLNVQGPPTFLRQGGFTIETKLPYRIPTPFRTFSMSDAAGWYSASWGALPYSFSLQPAEVFVIFRYDPPAN